ncbi:hypothetical protein [Rhizobium sp. 22-785-1]
MRFEAIVFSRRRNDQHAASGNLAPTARERAFELLMNTDGETTKDASDFGYVNALRFTKSVKVDLGETPLALLEA